jgi:hypothetical protein
MVIGCQFAHKFDFHHRKTYNPPSVLIFKDWDDYKLLAYIVGFIDGDGSIYKSGRSTTLKIENHGSWYDIHNFIIHFLSTKYDMKFQNNNRTKITKRGCSMFATARMDFLIKFKYDVEQLGIPFMKRKWDKIHVK